MFCRSGCASAYKKEKQEKKNGSLPAKSTGSRAPKRKTVLDNGSPIGEREVFERIWGTEPNERRSFVTGLLLPDINNAYPWYFSHILPKGGGRYPMFKYYARNIVLKTFEEHTEWEHHQYRIIGDDRWKHVFALQEDLKKEYQEHRQMYEAGKVEYYKI
jgi:hypothetical protein